MGKVKVVCGEGDSVAWRNSDAREEGGSCAVPNIQKDNINHTLLKTHNTQIRAATEMSKLWRHRWEEAPCFPPPSPLQVRAKRVGSDRGTHTKFKGKGSHACHLQQGNNWDTDQIISHGFSNGLAIRPTHFGQKCQPPPT